MYTPLPDIPLLMKKPSNQEKRVEEMTGGHTSNQQPLGELSFAFFFFGFYEELSVNIYLVLLVIRISTPNRNDNLV